MRLRCLFSCSVDVFTNFRGVCNVTSCIYELHFIMCLITITKMPCDQYMFRSLCGWPLPKCFAIKDLIEQKLIMELIAF